MPLDYFDLLLDIAVLSARLRIKQALGLIPSHEDKDAWQKRTHPYIRLNDEILGKMRELGRRCRDSAVDARSSAFWPLFACQNGYVESYEYRSKLRLAKLSLRAIYDVLCREDKVLGNDWGIYLVRSRKTNDDCERIALPLQSRLSSTSSGVKLPSAFSGSAVQTSESGKRGKKVQFDGFLLFCESIEAYLREHYGMSSVQAKRIVDSESEWLVEIGAEDRDAASAAKTIVEWLGDDRSSAGSQHSR